MNKQFALTLALSVVFTTPLAVAQMRGSGGMGQGSGMGGGQMGSSGMGGEGMGRGMGGRQTDWPDTGGSQMQHRRRQMHTTELQDDKYRRCRQSMDRVRHRLQQMSNLSRTQSPDLSQLDQLQDQLSVAIQEMEQQLDELVASLNDDQKSADQKKIQDLLQNTKDLDVFLDELGDELDQDNADSAKVRDKIRKTDGAAKQVQKQERELAESLGIEP